MADVRNHLLSFSVLALLNAHSPGAIAQSVIPLCTQKITLDDLTGEEGFFVFKEFEENDKLESAQTAHLEIAPQTVPQEAEWFEVAFLRQMGGTIKTSDNFSVAMRAHDADAVYGLESAAFTRFENKPKKFQLALNTQNDTRPMSSATGWLLTAPRATTEDLPDEINIQVRATGLFQESAEVTALAVYDSQIDYKGRLTLAAESDHDAGVYALSLSGSRFHFESSGHSAITGNIHLGADDELSILLGNATDRFTGRIVSDAYDYSNAKIGIRNGAVWKTQGQNWVNEFHWGKDGILDITDAHDMVSIKSVGTGIGTVKNSAGEAIENVTLIEDGARLRVKISDADIGSDRYKLSLGNVKPLNPEGSRFFVEVMDVRTNKDSSELNIGLIRVDNVDDSLNKFFAESVPTYYETALGSYKTYAAIGTDGADGFVISAMATDRLGASTLAKNYLDFSSALTIAHEQNAMRAFDAVTERLSQSTDRGLWVSAQMGETELNLNNKSRSQDLKTESLTLGFDRAVDLGFKDAAAGLWASVSRSDSDPGNASADFDETSVGFYFHGITRDNYRLILQAHYGLGDNTLASPGYFGENHSLLTRSFSMDSQSYGAGLYFGFTYPDLPPEWFFEPYVSGYTYWVKTDPSNEKEGVRFENEKVHQSVVKLGVGTGYKADQVALYAQGAWAHRFGQSFDVTGFEENLTETFETEDLQESWGEFKVSVKWQARDDLTLSAQAAAYASEIVKPKYSLGLGASYLLP